MDTNQPNSGGNPPPAKRPRLNISGTQPHSNGVFYLAPWTPTGGTSSDRAVGESADWKFQQMGRQVQCKTDGCSHTFEDIDNGNTEYRLKRHARMHWDRANPIVQTNTNSLHQYFNVLPEPPDVEMVEADGTVVEETATTNQTTTTATLIEHQLPLLEVIQTQPIIEIVREKKRCKCIPDLFDCTSYPFHLHSRHNLTFAATVEGTIESGKCRKRNHLFAGHEQSINPDQCIDCFQLNQFVEMPWPPKNKRDKAQPMSSMNPQIQLRCIYERSRSTVYDKTRANHINLNFQQLQKKLGRDRVDRNTSNMRLQNNRRTINRLSKIRQQHKDLMEAVASGEIPRIHAYFQRNLHRGESLEKLLSDLTSAHATCTSLNIIRSVRGFTDAEDCKAILLLKLGGRRALRVAQRMGLPGRGRLRGHDLMQCAPFIMAPGDFIHHKWILDVNLDRQFWSRSLTSNLRKLHNLQADNTAVEKRIRYHTKYGWMLGYCNQHGPHKQPFDITIDDEPTNSSLPNDWQPKFNAIIETNNNGGNDASSKVDDTLNPPNTAVYVKDPEDIAQAAQELKDDNRHHAKEVMIVGIARNASTNYTVAPIFGQGTCTKDDDAKHAFNIFLGCILAWYLNPLGYSLRGPLSNIATDGAAVFVLAAMMFETFSLADIAVNCAHFLLFNSLFKLLGSLPLFDLSIGMYGIVFNCDAKHAFKRWRMRLKSASSHMRVKNKVITLNAIKDVLRHGAGVAESKFKLFLRFDCI